MRALTLAFLTLGLTAALLTSPLLNRALLTPAKALTVEKRAAPDRAATTPADPTATQVAWEDLTPPLSDDARQAVQTLNEKFDQLSQQEAEALIAIVAENGNQVITRFDGQKISIRGYLVPLDFSTKKATEFVLVPFLGACIHVPPPPPNQIILVSYDAGIPMQEIEDVIFHSFTVTGILNSKAQETELAEVGYTMTASRIDRHAL
ncbi:MAG TPA: hypothetical protein DCO73_05355 [Alphaproteobacteria bacterium]|nr:hypothetical protein [Alphaproteobacteria bacterium]